MRFLVNPEPLGYLQAHIMNNDNLMRLAATLDSQSMTGACHRVDMNPVTTDSVLKLAGDLLKNLLRDSRQQKQP